MFYAALVFLAGCSYGILTCIVKLAYSDGFVVGEVVGMQNLSGLLMLLCITLIFFRHKVKLKSILSLMATGIALGLTGILYSGSLQYIPAAIAIVFLFQFTWIGIIIEAIANRQWPSKKKLISVPFLLIGTLMAGGTFELDKINIPLHGAIQALLSSISYALFIFFSGRVATNVPAINRSLFVVAGSLATICIVYPPHFLINGALTEGLLEYGILMGLFGAIIPPLFFAKGTPHVGSGLASILSSSELPAAVLLAIVLLGEQISGIRWIGICIILIGIGLPYFLEKNNRKITEIQKKKKSTVNY